MTAERSDNHDDRTTARRDRLGDAVDARPDELDMHNETSASPAGTPPPAESESDPPRTTTGGWFTAPKLGSAGSGGAELEPGPERD